MQFSFLLYFTRLEHIIFIRTTIVFDQEDLYSLEFEMFYINHQKLLGPKKKQKTCNTLD